MYQTYKMMFNATNSQYLDKSLETLCEDYKATNIVGKRNKIIAAMFCKVFPMILKIQEKYYSLTNEQKVEHALFHLVRSVKYYQNNNIKFSSFFYTHLTNQMKSLLTSENSLKKAVFQNIVRNNDDVLKLYTCSQPAKSYENSERYLINNIKTSQYLSQEEKEYCLCYLMGYTSVPQLSEKLNIESRVDEHPKHLKKAETEEEQAILDKQREQRRLRKIRQSIKEKANKYGKHVIFS